MKHKPNFKFRLMLSDADVTRLRDAGDIEKVRVKIEATHAGIVNSNSFFYLPKGMKNGAKTFTTPYPKPVMVAHDQDKDPVGRISKAKYIDYPEVIADFKDAKNPGDVVDQVIDFTKSKTFKAKDFKGLGHIELIADITDSDAIAKVLDKRYLTVSIGGNVDSAICSICATDKMNEDESVPYEDRCNHWRGETYDGEKAFLIGGNMEFNEVSYVNTPADKNAVSEVINDNVDDITFSEQSFEILDFEVKNKNAGETTLKKTLAAILKDKDVSQKALGDLGLSTLVLADDRYAKLRKTSFLFADQKAIPVNDKAHILAAYHILTEVEDSEEKTQVLEVLDRKFKNQFGETSMEDALEAMQAEHKEVEDESIEAPAAAAPVLDTEALAKEVTDAVVLQLKESFNVSDSYVAQRNDALETEVTALESELEELTDKYKSALVGQIMAISDTADKETLETRTLDSLHDKLVDLGYGIQDESSEDNVQDENNEGLEDTDVDINDAADEEGELENNASDTNVEDEAETLTVKQVKDEHSKILKKEGLRAASRYIADLRDKKTLPKNFTF